MTSPNMTETEKTTAAIDSSISTQIDGLRDGMLTVYSCPDCGGVLWQAQAGAQLEFRCHIGHVLSAQSLLEQQVDALEASIWTAFRILRDRERLLRQLSVRSREGGEEADAERLLRQAVSAQGRADALRLLIEAGF